MCCLLDLPPELLELICGRVRSNDLIKFWRTGSRLLLTKLSAGGITSIALEDENPTSVSRWPGFELEVSVSELRQLPRACATVKLPRSNLCDPNTPQGYFICPISVPATTTSCVVQ